eukprot:2499863-Rhodomonas_salina.1
MAGGSDDQGKGLDSIAEGMGGASLATPTALTSSATASNPDFAVDKDSDGKGREEELIGIQSRLPFVPCRPFSLDGVSDKEKSTWLPNLQSVISETSRVVYDNLALISGGEKATEDGSGPMEGLDLSQ